MIWLNPLAWLGLAAVAVPVAVHLLAHRRAERIAFPTLRFLQPTRLAAIQRRAFEDLALLAVRSAIVSAAVAAFAGPLLVTPARRAESDARLVTEAAETAPLSEAIHRAVARLESAPPARRELLIAAPLTIGSLSAADLAAVPPDVGIRFTRVGNLPAARTIDAPPLLSLAGDVQRTVTLEGRETTARETRVEGRPSWPVEIVAPPSVQSSADAAMAAVLSLRVRIPPADRRARLVLFDAANSTGTWGPALRQAQGRPEQGRRTALAGPTLSDPSAIRSPWMADAVARIARDVALGAESARTPNGLVDPRFGQLPWQVIARALDGRPVASAASADRLMVAAVARDGDLLMPTLLRAIATNLAPETSLLGAEVVPIPDSQLRAWTRQPGPAPPPRPETVDRDDRRWLWGAVLVLLLIEAWMRRETADTQQAIEETRARVA
jgi:aerotolerance regulator-like protein